MKEYKYRNNYYSEDALLETWLKDKHNKYYDVTYGGGYRVQLIELTEEELKKQYKSFNSRYVEYKDNDKRYAYRTLDKVNLKDVQCIYLTSTRGIYGNITCAIRVRIIDNRIVAMKY